ncbi:flagellar hook-length control protein FliK [Halothiobacillus sp. DCM-1]|uniref:flagellar hook-length control protein FliK n=1 Tax=Halothiobacillus sp. DCM-1 TaxID=3112558 RepID=UPI00324E75B9
MPTAATTPAITNLLNPVASVSPAAASGGDADGSGFAQLMQGAIARQTPAANPVARPDAPSASAADTPTPSTLIATLQQLLGQGSTSLASSSQAASGNAALRAQWQTFMQQLSAWLNASGEGQTGSRVSDGNAEAWAKLQALVNGYLAANPDALGGEDALRTKLTEVLKQIQPGDQTLSSGDAAWLAALQPGLAAAVAQPAGGASEGAGLPTHGAGQRSLATTALGLGAVAGGGAESALPAGGVGVGSGGQTPQFAAALLNPVQDALPQSAEAMLAQLASARQSGQSGIVDRATDNSANGLSVLPLGFSVPNAAMQTAPLAVPAPLALQQPESMNQLGQTIQWMVGQNISRANLSLHPEHLGPLQISIDQKNDQTTIQITAMHSITRDLLDQQLPKLREWLNEAGLANAQISLNMGQFGQQSAGQSAGQSSSKDAATGRESSGDSVQPVTAAPAESTILQGRISRLGVDTFV